MNIGIPRKANEKTRKIWIKGSWNKVTKVQMSLEKERSLPIVLKRLILGTIW